MSTLPQELADWIIDYLPGDPKGLSVGSLVSHAWLNSCRLHRFRKFVLAEYDKPLETWSIVAGLIRDLTVKNYPTFVEIAQCTQLERLELRNYSFPPGIPTSIEFFFPKLKELHLTRCFFSYPEDLTSFISGFPSLSSFLWKRFDVPDQDLLKYDAYTSVTSSAPLSTHLCIAEDPHTAHIDVLYLLSRSAQFKSIELHKWNSRPVSLNWVLRRCGPTLRELDIRSIQILACKQLYHVRCFYSHVAFSGCQHAKCHHRPLSQHQPTSPFYSLRHGPTRLGFPTVIHAEASPNPGPHHRILAVA